jgi:hypothetical protein
MESKELSGWPKNTPSRHVSGQPDSNPSGKIIEESEPASRPDGRRWGDEWSEESRIAKAKELGLPEDTPWEQIVAVWEEQERVALAKELSLPEDTERHEIDRVAEVRKLGLPEDASWTDIYRAWDEQARVALAEELGLQKEWTEYVSWRSILTKVLDIDVRGPLLVEDIVERIRESKSKGLDR